MVAVNNVTSYPTSSKYWVNNTDGTNGFISALACVTQDGYGYNGRIAQACAQGKYNNRDNYMDCKDCPYGMTTEDVGKGFTLDNCGVAAGFGWVNGKVDLCPIGTYNNDTWDAGAYAGMNQANCTVCPDGTTTAQSGSNAAGQCSYCQLGRGGVNCNQTCGGDTDMAMAGYVSFLLLCLLFLGSAWLCCRAANTPPGSFIRLDDDDTVVFVDSFNQAASLAAQLSQGT
jgi:hypothetical protein